MNIWESLLGGMIAGFGMFIVSTVFGLLVFWFTKPRLIKMISEMWREIKTAGLEVEVKIDGKKKEKK
jgi:hypothetical protein